MKEEPATKQPMHKTAWVSDAVDRYEAALLRYAVRITQDQELAREVVQEAFLRLCETDPDRMADHLAPWLYTVTRNQALNVRKKEARVCSLNQRLAENQPDSAKGPGERALRNEQHTLVLETMNGLPAQQQEACRLKLHHDFTYREISTVMGISLGKVSTLITTGLDTIRARLRARLELAQEG